MAEYDKIQLALHKLLETQRPYTNIVNSSERIKQLELLILSASSYADGVSVLMKYEKYDSVLLIGRAFLELYASIIYMFDIYLDTNKFDNYFKKMIVDDMEQDRKTYNSIKKDITIPESNTKKSDLKSYLIRWENMICEFFPDRKNSIDEKDKETSIHKIIKDLNDDFRKEYKDICGDKNSFIGNALSQNMQIISSFGKPCESSFSIYRLLCTECHGNIGALDTRMITNGMFIPNIGSENNASAVSDLIYWSLEDITVKIDNLLKAEKQVAHMKNA